MPAPFRGVVHSGVFVNPRQLALVVGHPHPDGDFGGGPGPVDNWRLPYDFDAYLELVDDDAGDPEDAMYEVRRYQHIATRRDGAWSLHELPGSGTIDALECTGPETYRALVSYGGSAAYMALLAGSSWTTLEYAGLPRMAVESQVCFSGDDVVIAYSMSFDPDAPSEVAIGVREGDHFSWKEQLGSTPGRVTHLASAVDAQGRRLIVAGGKALWRYEDGRWSEIHAFLGGALTFLSVSAGGDVLAATASGQLISGTTSACRMLGRVGRIHSAVRFGQAIFAADEERVYRFDGDGHRACLHPEVEAAGDWPSAGRLALGDGRLWLAGSHAIVSTVEGVEWVTHTDLD